MKKELQLVLIVALALAALEMAARVLEPRLSQDVRNILAHREIPKSIAEVGRDGGTSVLVIGNSLARACVDRESLQEGLSRKGYPRPRVFFMTPDASGVNEWAAAYRKHFSHRGSSPDFILIVTGPEHLLDMPVRSPEKMAAFHTAPDEKLEVVRNWMTGTNERSRFLLASVSRLFANRERLRPILFYNFVPGFEETAQRINRAEAGEEVTPRRAASAARFEFLLESIELPGERLLVAAAALPDKYEIPIVVKKVASERGAVLIEDGSHGHWPESAFPDGYHLSDRYSPEFTRGVVSKVPEAREQ